MQLIKTFIIVFCFCSTAAAASDIWTNYVGRVFSARLIGVNERGATFIFHEDGATNTIRLAKLSEASAERACDMFDFVPVPPRLVATYNRAKADLRRISDLQDDGVLSAEKAKERRLSVKKTFLDVCLEKGFKREIVERLVKQLY